MKPRSPAYISPRSRKALERWQMACEATAVATQEQLFQDKPGDQAARKERALADYRFFAQTYFPQLCKAPCAQFQVQFFEAAASDPRFLGVAEWPREHAKSIHGSTIAPLWLLVRGQLSGCLLVSSTYDKAAFLLADLAEQLTSNHLFIHDWGDYYQRGTWQEGHFVAKGSILFAALGLGQSPRGLRAGANRPNLLIGDDLDTAAMVENLRRVKKAVKWLFEDAYFALDTRAARMWCLGNRIHPHSILAHVVGDVEEGDPKREGLYHSKVYALQDSKGRMAYPHGEPAWKERYTREEIITKINTAGHYAAMQEFFHTYAREGTIFKHDWWQYTTPLPYRQYDRIVAYFDPSFKDTATSDYKAIVVVGKTASHFHGLDVFVRRCSVAAVIAWLYELETRYRAKDAVLELWMEQQFIDEMFRREIAEQSVRYGFHLRMRYDKRKKPNKAQRIENLTPIFEAGRFCWNEKLKGKPDFITLKNQFMGFERGANLNDDAPDATEGAVWLLEAQPSWNEAPGHIQLRTRRNQL
jgi:predicted phage terminase large subunit-like protein